MAYVFEEPVNWLFILSRYSVTVSHSGIEPTIAGSIMFFITAKHFLFAVTHFLCLKAIGYLLGFKIPFFSCPSGINLFCLPHRCHKLSGTRWCDYPVHLRQDENQVKTFLIIKITPFACLDSNVGQNQNIQLFLYTNSTSPLGRNRINA